MYNTMSVKNDGKKNLSRRKITTFAKKNYTYEKQINDHKNVSFYENRARGFRALDGFTNQLRQVAE